jgi:hypothetical protein
MNGPAAILLSYITVSTRRERKKERKEEREQGDWLFHPE